MTEQDAGMLPLLHPRPAPPYRARPGYQLVALVALVVVAVAHHKLGLSASATASTTGRGAASSRPSPPCPTVPVHRVRADSPGVSDVDTPCPDGLVIDACVVAPSQPGSHAGWCRWSAALRGQPAAARAVPGARQRPTRCPHGARRVHLDRSAVSTPTGVHSDRCPVGQVRCPLGPPVRGPLGQGSGVCCRPAVQAASRSVGAVGPPP
jgi:hypothetical protein